MFKARTGIIQNPLSPVCFTATLSSPTTCAEITSLVMGFHRGAQSVCIGAVTRTLGPGTYESG